MQCYCRSRCCCKSFWRRLLNLLLSFSTFVVVVQCDYPVRTCDGQQVVLLPAKAVLELCAPRLGLQPRTGPPPGDRVRGEPGPVSEEAGHNHVRGGAGFANEVEQLAACNY